MTSWKTISAGLAVVWAFFSGYITAIGFSRSISWNVRDIAYSLERGMTGDALMSLFNFPRWNFVILTICLMVSFLFLFEEEEE